MSTASGVFKGCRALLAAAKSSTPKSSPATTTAAKLKPTSSSSPPPPPTSSSSSSSAAAAAKPRSSPSEPRKPARPPGILKVFPVSPALHRVLGVSAASRTEAVKKIWEYVKLHNLQNPANKREIYCDDKLKTIFQGKDKVGFLEVGKLLSPHFVKTD